MSTDYTEEGGRLLLSPFLIKLMLQLDGPVCPHSCGSIWVTAGKEEPHIPKKCNVDVAV